MSVRTLPGGALVVWPETLSRTPQLINKSAGGGEFTLQLRLLLNWTAPLLTSGSLSSKFVNSAVSPFDPADPDLRAVFQVLPRVANPDQFATFGKPRQ